MKTKVNFIVTCYNRENYWPHLKALLESYETIEPIICLAYNGEDPDFECDVRLPNSGLQIGEYELIKHAYYHLIDNDTESDIFIKIGIDSWMCDEDVINKIIMNMKHFRVPYAGNYWEKRTQLATDVFFGHIAYGNIFEDLEPDGHILEECMFNTVARMGGKFYNINERSPVHPDHRHSCEALGWTMEHDLKKNLAFVRNFKKKKPQRDILNAYSVVYHRPSDINQLLPIIHKYACECDDIVEMGVRDVVSTWALLAAFPKKMRSYDIEYSENIKPALELAKQAGIDFEFKKQDVIAEGFKIEKTDLLFIDTWHRYHQLKWELKKHGNQARKYLIFHDTETFGYKDEEEVDFKKQPQGLVKAIKEFLEENPHWVECEKVMYNNGLTVLKRDGR